MSDPWIALDKSWKVECQECGLLDEQPNKERALEVAAKHKAEQHGGKGRIGGTWYHNMQREAP